MTALHHHPEPVYPRIKQPAKLDKTPWMHEQMELPFEPGRVALVCPRCFEVDDFDADYVAARVGDSVLCVACGLPVRLPSPAKE